MNTAALLGAKLAEAGLALVYGGARVGLMGAVADGALAREGRVVGVMPRELEGFEVAHQGLSELIWAADLYDRKRQMAARADAFVVLPGGFGTLEEAFEVISWKQMRMFDKPVVLVDACGFFQPLVALASAIVREGFAYTRSEALFTVVSRVEEVVPLLSEIPSEGDRP